MFANLARLCLRVLLPVTLVGAVACGNDPASVTATGTASSAVISDFIAEAVGGVTTINEGGTGNFTISRLCNPASALSHTVTWDYGDSTTTSDTLVGTASTGAVAGGGCVADYPVDFATQVISIGTGDLQSPSYTYADDGSYSVTAQANDGSGSLTQTITMTVNNVLPVTTLTGPSGVTREGDSYNFAGSVADSGTTATEISYVVWDFGDGTVNQYDCSTDSATEALCTTTRARTRAHVFADDGTYTVHLRVCDDSRTTAPGTTWTSTPAGCSDDEVTVTIDNRVPVPSSITSDAPSNIIAEGSAIGFTASYTDQGADTHAIVWSYGDGSANDTGTADSIPPPSPSNMSPAGILTPSHTYCNANGGTQISQTVTLRVDDDNGGWGTQTLLVLVNDVNPIVSLSPSATTIDEGGNVTFTVTASSGSTAAACDTLTATPYTWSCGGSGASVVSGCSSTDTTCVCKYADGTATYTASVKVDDEDSSTTKTQDITVNNVNPVADAGPNQTINEGQAVTFAGSATDVGSPETLTYTWTLPGPTVIGVGMGPTHLFTQHGTYTVTLTVTDGDGGTHTDTVVITVNDVDPQNVLVTGTGPYVEGASYTFMTTADTGATPNNVDALTTYDIDWGDGDTDTGIALGTNATHIYADNGPYTITSTVSDEDSTAADTLAITVTNVAPSAANATADDTTPEEGATVTFGGSFVDPSSDDTFDIEWDFDDGTPVATATVGAGVRTIPAAAHAFMEQGTYVVQVTVTDDDGGVTTDTITVTVSDISPVTTGTVLARSGNEGSPVAFSFVASSLYPAADDIGDGAPPNPYQFDCDNNGSYETTSATVSANCTFAQDGSYSVPAQVCDEDSCSTVTFTATISNVLPVLTLPANPAAFPEGDPAGFVFTGASFVDPGADTWFASWTFTDPDTGSIITRMPTVQPTAAGAIAGTAAYTFQDDESSGDCGGAACGPSETPYRRVCAVLTLTDDDGSVSTPSTVGGGCYQLRIENVDPALAAPLQVTVPNPIVGEGTAVSFIVNASDVGDADNELTYTFDWNDGSSNTVLVGQDATSHMFPTAGTYTVQITVTDDDGGFVQATDIEIEVVNVPPNIIAVLETGPKPENSSIAVSVVLESFTVGDLTYAYNWGDGSPVDIQDELTGGSVATHVYPQDGTYTVTVTVTDDVGDFDTVTTPVVITNVAPVVSVQTPSPINEGLGVTLSVTATDASPSDGRTFQVDWNGSGSFTTITPGGTAPNFTLSSGAFTYADNGIFVAKVRVSDDDTFTEVASPIIVNNRNPTLSSFSQTGAAATEGTLPVNVTATATDVATDALSYFFDFGDGTSATDSDGTVSHVYRQDSGVGTYTISVRVTDDDGGVTTSTLNATVANIAPVLSSVDVPSSATAGSAISATIFASDPGADVLEYAWRFGGTPGVWQFTSTSSNTRSFTFDSAGTYDVELGVRDSGTASWVTTLRTISVTTPGTSLTVRATGPINEGGSTTLTVTPAGTGPYLVDIDWQDDGSYDQQLSDPGNTTLTFTTTHAYMDNGQYRIRTRVTDQGAGGGVATTVVTVAVDNVAPTLLPATVTQTTASEGVAYTAPAFSVVDPAGGNDTPVYSLASAPAGMTINAGTGAISWVPGYAAAVAPNGVVVEVSDGDGGMDSVAWLITVTPIDADSDGLPDNWEIANFGGTGENGSGDDDGDGISNQNEFLNGTDPQVSNAPGVATLLAPVDMLVGTATPTLVVNNAVDPDADALTYTFEIFDTDAVATATPVVVEAGVAEGSGTTSWTVASALTEGETYWWRVTANDGVVDGPASEAAWFTVSTVNDPPAAPALVYPVASGVVDSAQPYLEATMVMDPDGDAVTYGFAIYSDSSMTTLVTSVAGRPLPFWVVDVALEHDTQYWWRASATDGFSAPVMSASSTFTVDLPVSNVAPSAPTVVSPDDVTVTTTTPTLSVQNATDDDGDALSYFFEVASNAGFTGASLQVSAEIAEGTSTTDFVVATALQEDRTYYWRARAYDGIVTGEWAVGTFFVNSANNAPGVPRPLSPSNAALLSMAPMELTIANVSDPEGSAVTYTFQLMADAAASTVLETGTNVASGAGSTTSWAFTTAITPGTVYYWRARASDGAAQSAYSSVYSFSVYDQAAVDAAIAAAAQAAADANAAAAAAQADADAAAAAAANADADAAAAQADADAAAAAAANADADAAAAQADADAAQNTADGAVAASDAAAKDAKSAIKTAKNAGCSGTGDTSLWMLLVLAPLGFVRRRRRA